MLLHTQDSSSGGPHAESPHARNHHQDVSVYWLQDHIAHTCSPVRYVALGRLGFTVIQPFLPSLYCGQQPLLLVSAEGCLLDQLLRQQPCCQDTVVHYCWPIWQRHIQGACKRQTNMVMNSTQQAAAALTVLRKFLCVFPLQALKQYLSTNSISLIFSELTWLLPWAGTAL